MERNIPELARIERDCPIEEMYHIALREGNKKRPIYEVHKWWARRLGSNFRMLLKSAQHKSGTRIETLWKSFYENSGQQNLTLLDPFMGGGTSIIEATKCGFRTVGVDIDPVAWFITKKELDACDIGLIKREFDRIKGELEETIKSNYKTKLKDGEFADVIYYFWVDVIKCRECGDIFEAHPHFRLYESRKNKYQVVFCPDCHTIKKIPINQNRFLCKICRTYVKVNKGTVKNAIYRCPSCQSQGSMRNLGKPGKPISKKIFALEYLHPVSNSREFKMASDFDYELFHKACEVFDRREKDLLFPRDAIPTENRKDKRPISHGYTHYYQLFNKRQLLSLSLIYGEILKIRDANIREFLLLAFSDSLANNNMLCYYAFAYRKLTPLFGLHAYRMITRPVEGNVWGIKFGRGSFTSCVFKMLRGKDYCVNPYELSYSNGKLKKVYTNESLNVTVTSDPQRWYEREGQCLLINKSSEDLSYLQDATIDFILTDPPYYDNLSYSELADFYYVWLKDQLIKYKIWNQPSTPYKEALFVSRRNKEEHERFVNGLIKVFRECRRVLKPEGLMILTYHHKDIRAWISLATAFLESGFEVTNVFPIRSEGRSGFHSASGNIKWDSVFCCRPTGLKKKRVIKQHYLRRWTNTRMHRWTKRLNDAGTEFSEADAKSLLFSLAVARLTQYPVTTEDAIKLLNGLNSKRW
ncbi:MAG: DUF1156 domain-containing protein [Methanosarcinales archaeon]|nr:MAG: DUF1156 domain-containing protein [Methanosarcinales archaeon]